MQATKNILDDNQNSKFSRVCLELAKHHKMEANGYYGKVFSIDSNHVVKVYKTIDHVYHTYIKIAEHCPSPHFPEVLMQGASRSFGWVIMERLTEYQYESFYGMGYDSLMTAIEYEYNETSVEEIMPIAIGPLRHELEKIRPLPDSIKAAIDTIRYIGCQNGQLDVNHRNIMLRRGELVFTDPLVNKIFCKNKVQPQKNEALTLLAA